MRSKTKLKLIDRLKLSIDKHDYTEFEVLCEDIKNQPLDKLYSSIYEPLKKYLEAIQLNKGYNKPFTWTYLQIFAKKLFEHCNEHKIALPKDIRDHASSAYTSLANEILVMSSKSNGFTILNELLDKLCIQHELNLKNELSKNNFGCDLLKICRQMYTILLDTLVYKPSDMSLLLDSNPERAFKEREELIKNMIAITKENSDTHQHILNLELSHLIDCADYFEQYCLDLKTANLYREKAFNKRAKLVIEDKSQKHKHDRNDILFLTGIKSISENNQYEIRYKKLLDKYNTQSNTIDDFRSKLFLNHMQYIFSDVTLKNIEMVDSNEKYEVIDNNLKSWHSYDHWFLYDDDESLFYLHNISYFYKNRKDPESNKYYIRFICDLALCALNYKHLNVFSRLMSEDFFSQEILNVAATNYPEEINENSLYDTLSKTKNIFEKIENNTASIVDFSSLYEKFSNLKISFASLFMKELYFKYLTDTIEINEICHELSKYIKSLPKMNSDTSDIVQELYLSHATNLLSQFIANTEKSESPSNLLQLTPQNELQVILKLEINKIYALFQEMYNSVSKEQINQLIYNRLTLTKNNAFHFTMPLLSQHSPKIKENKKQSTKAKKIKSIPKPILPNPKPEPKIETKLTKSKPEPKPKPKSQQKPKKVEPIKKQIEKKVVPIKKQSTKQNLSIIDINTLNDRLNTDIINQIKQGDEPSNLTLHIINKKNQIIENNVVPHVNTESKIVNPEHQIAPIHIINTVPEYLLELNRILASINFSLYLSGGSVRDHINGEVPKDYDLICNGERNEIYKSLTGKFLEINDGIIPDMSQIEHTKTHKFMFQKSNYIDSLITCYVRDKHDNEITTIDITCKPSFKLSYKQMNRKLMFDDFTCNAVVCKIDEKRMIVYAPNMSIKDDIVNKRLIPVYRFNEPSQGSVDIQLSLDDHKHIWRAIKFTLRGYQDDVFFQDVNAALKKLDSEKLEVWKEVHIKIASHGNYLCQFFKEHNVNDIIKQLKKYALLNVVFPDLQIDDNLVVETPGNPSFEDKIAIFCKLAGEKWNKVFNVFKPKLSSEEQNKICQLLQKPIFDNNNNILFFNNNRNNIPSKLTNLPPRNNF